jgi:anti-anti-sigma factor
MQLQVVQDGPRTRVILDGRLDMAGVQAVNDRFATGISTGAGPAIVDFAKVTFVSSVGISMLVNAAKSLQRTGRSLVLLRPQPLVEEGLRTAGLHHVITITHEEGNEQAPRR